MRTLADVHIAPEANYDLYRFRAVFVPQRKSALSTISAYSNVDYSFTQSRELALGISFHPISRRVQSDCYASFLVGLKRLTIILVMANDPTFAHDCDVRSYRALNDTPKPCLRARRVRLSVTTDFLIRFLFISLCELATEQHEKPRTVVPLGRSNW